MSEAAKHRERLSHVAQREVETAEGVEPVERGELRSDGRLTAKGSHLLWWHVTKWCVRTNGVDYFADDVTCLGRLKTEIIDDAKRDLLPNSPKAVVSIQGTIILEGAVPV